MQAKFEKQGFLTVKFLDEAELDYINRFFDELHPDPQGGFVSGSYSQDIAYKKKASDEIVRVFSKHYERFFVSYQPFGAAFLYKLPSQESELAIHQDWTIVDESKFVALNCWVPLNDIDETNGALHVLPGSHFNSLNVVRAPTLPFFFSGNDAFMIEQSEPMYVKAGEAVILNQSTVHYSPPNRSSKIRKAITAGVKSKGTPMIFHYNDSQRNNGKLEVFEMPEDFLISFADFGKDIGERPKMGASKGFIEYNLPQLSGDELKTLVGKMRASAGFPAFRNSPKKKNLFEQITSIFN